MHTTILNRSTDDVCISECICKIQFTVVAQHIKAHL